MKTAIIDIGSNTVRCGVVHTQRQNGKLSFFCPQGKQLVTARLGKGLTETGLLSPDSMSAAIEGITAFYTHHIGLMPVFAYATSAVRDAANKDVFLQRLHAQCPVAVEVLSGELEGKLAYLGIGGQGSLIDIGGGSAQLVYAKGSVSRPTGCVRAKDICPSLPIEAMKAILYPWLDARWDSFPPVSAPYYGVGGTITSLGAYMAGQTRYDGQALSPICGDSLDSCMHRLYENIACNAPLPLLGQRREVILQGGVILSYLMERLSIPQLTPLDRDGLEGYAAYLFEKGVLCHES